MSQDAALKSLTVLWAAATLYIAVRYLVGKVQLHIWRRAVAQPNSGPGLKGLSAVPLLGLIVGVLFLSLVTAAIAYVLIGYLVEVGTQPLTAAQRLTATFATLTALGAVVALVVNIRKQDVAEQSATREIEAAATERFRSAATLMGGESAAESLAGIHALAAVADEYPRIRQQVVDVFCEYLRLASYQKRASGDERDLRRDPYLDAIVTRILLDRVGRNARTSWSECEFNFSRMEFWNVDFSHSIFRGEVTFKESTFTGDSALFVEAVFTKGASFEESIFEARTTSFVSARFLAEATFVAASFTGRSLLFRGVQFDKGSIFTGAVFNCTAGTQFDDAHFHGASTFNFAIFKSARTSFHGARWEGSGPSFHSANFDSAATLFTRIGAEDTVDFQKSTVAGRLEFRAPKRVGASLAGMSIDASGEVVIEGERQLEGLGAVDRSRGGTIRVDG